MAVRPNLLLAQKVSYQRLSSGCPWWDNRECLNGIPEVFKVTVAAIELAIAEFTATSYGLPQRSIAFGARKMFLRQRNFAGQNIDGAQ